MLCSLLLELWRLCGRRKMAMGKQTSGETKQFCESAPTNNLELMKSYLDTHLFPITRLSAIRSGMWNNGAWQSSYILRLSGSSTGWRMKSSEDIESSSSAFSGLSSKCSLLNAFHAPLSEFNPTMPTNIYISNISESPWQFSSTIHLSYIRITYLLLQSQIVYMGIGYGT